MKLTKKLETFLTVLILVSTVKRNPVSFSELFYIHIMIEAVLKTNKKNSTIESRYFFHWQLFDLDVLFFQVTKRWDIQNNKPLLNYQ